MAIIVFFYFYAWHCLIDSFTWLSFQEKLGNARLVETGVNIHKIDDLRLKPIGTVNLLSRVNNSESGDTSNEDGASYEERKHGTKLHQLMDASPRTDAVAAG